MFWMSYYADCFSEVNKNIFVTLTETVALVLVISSTSEDGRIHVSILADLLTFYIFCYFADA